MQRSFSKRLAELEALEAAQEAERGRRLEVFLQIRPLDYFTLFEAEPRDMQACERIIAEYGLDQIDWDTDRVHVAGGTWPGVPPAHNNTIARVVLPENYGCRIDAAPWVKREPGDPFWGIALSGEKMYAIRRAHRAAICDGLDLVAGALVDGRAEVRPMMYGAGPGEPYGPRAYGLAMMSDPELLRWAATAERLMRAGEVRITTADDYRAWVCAYREGNSEPTETP